MFLVNYISRKDTDYFAPMFEICYILEVMNNVGKLLSLKFPNYHIYSLCNYSTQTRLGIVCAIAMDIIHSCSRVVIMHHQYFGTPEYVETSSLIICSLIKEFFLGYITGLIFIIALDRWVATKAWAWYENGGASTLLFFALHEAILFFHAMSVQSFILVYRLNLQEIRSLRRGAEVNRYSVAKTYQIRENLAVLNAYMQISRPIVLVTLPPFLFYPIFLLVPPNIGYDGLRFFSVEMFDVWLEIFSVAFYNC
ncbi:hypothetical protein PMAYCL1PPCAC_00021 [Pristionchus mayeri]|uniref:G protein-coupled receptor n=1 Tax=Pristionchus mayeri TaxID=1317129 RepID=A0AAN5C5Z8_9BILA|nr:hypothetical protein PMAYCL1PPCAC_00021 [Pristionchus mayeri]